MWGGGNLVKIFETKKNEFDFISKEIKNITKSEKIEAIPVTKSLYELIAYTCMIEKGKIIVDDEGIKYKGKNTKLVQDFFDPTKYDGDFSITERFKLFGSILCNTFWLVNDYAQQYVDDKGVKEDALKTLLDKFQNRNIDQQIHKSCDRHSLLIAALQKDKNYEYGDVVKTEGAIDGYLKILSLISPKRYEEYLLKQKTRMFIIAAKSNL